MSKYENLSESAINRLAQVNVAIPESDLWMNAGSRAIFDVAGIPLRVVTSLEETVPDYRAVVDFQMRQRNSLTPAAVVNVFELSPEEILEQLAAAKMGLGIISPEMASRLPKEVTKQTDLLLPLGTVSTTTATLVRPFDLTPFVENYSFPYYQELVTRLERTSIEVGQDAAFNRRQQAAAEVNQRREKGDSIVHKYQ